MSVSRACLTCRQAKAKCDLSRPTCGRCARRGLNCSGYPADLDAMFRDERAKAQRDSERARRSPPKQNTTTSTGSGSGFGSQQDEQVQNSIVHSDALLRGYYWWLNELTLAKVPEPLKKPVEDRAVDLFFNNWVLFRTNDGISEGYMHDLPRLYHEAAPDSALGQAVRAMAFADMKHLSENDSSFDIKARQQYGAALIRVRMTADDQQSLQDDHVLAAILLIDSFESMYLARTEPLGPHTEAIKHLLRARGDGQFLDKTRFALWRTAHHRLQARQLMLRQGPEQDQITWIDKLDNQYPENRITGNILRINMLVNEAQTLIHGGSDDQMPVDVRLGQANQLLYSMQELVDSIEAWQASLNNGWNHEVTNIQAHELSSELGDRINIGLPDFPYPRFITYHDLWIAYLCNFHTASQIVLRESLADVTTYAASLLGTLSTRETSLRIEVQKNAVESLSSVIMRSFPPLMGFTHRKFFEAPWGPQGKMAGRFFCLCAVWVVQKAQYTSQLHKRVAADVIEWINTSHGLG